MILTMEDCKTRRKIATEMVASNSFEQVYYKTELDYLDTVAALQSERDTLREALKSLESSGDDGACPSCGHHPMNGHTAQCVFKVVLSTPASGEPARKP